MTRRLGAGLVIAVLSILLAGPAYASRDPSDPPHKCFVENANGDLPTCTSDGNGKWTATYPDDSFDPTSNGGIPSGFIAVFVLVAVVGAAVSIGRIVFVRNMARNAGLDPNQATAVSLLSNDGIDATYLAANLRPPLAPAPPAHSPSTAGSSPRSTQERLNELKQLRDQGDITPEEYDARRTSIIDAI